MAPDGHMLPLTRPIKTVVFLPRPTDLSGCHGNGSSRHGELPPPPPGPGSLVLSPCANVHPLEKRSSRTPQVGLCSRYRRGGSGSNNYGCEWSRETRVCTGVCLSFVYPNLHSHKPMPF